MVLLLLSTPSIMKLLFMGRWPPTEGPVPWPTPPLLATPELSRESCNAPKFPWAFSMMGRLTIWLDSNELPTWAVVVSIAAAASLTSTVALTLPIWSVTFAVSVLFSSTLRLLIAAFAKPDALAVRLYRPTGMLLNRYSPPLVVLNSVFTPVATLVMTTFAFGTMPPLASTTVPTRLPSVAWPKDKGAKLAKTMAQTRHVRNLLIFLLKNESGQLTLSP